jgi:hypothetical protein
VSEQTEESEGCKVFSLAEARAVREPRVRLKAPRADERIEDWVWVATMPDGSKPACVALEFPKDFRSAQGWRLTPEQARLLAVVLNVTAKFVELPPEQVEHVEQTTDEPDEQAKQEGETLMIVQAVRAWFPFAAWVAIVCIERAFG